MKNEQTQTTKNALVTGASRGIGEAILRKLVKKDFFVYGTYNTSQESARKIERELEGKVKFLNANFSEVSKLRNLIQELIDIKFDVIVNNAGTFYEEDFDNFDTDIWYETLQVNLNSVLEICVGLKDSLTKNAKIVNISSTDGNIGSFNSMAYSASKAALTNLTKSLANNFGREGIRVNSISPGWINTSMATKASMEAEKLTPLGRNGKPEEIANVVDMLISDRCSFINGSNIVVDGGYSNVDYIMMREAGLE